MADQDLNAVWDTAFGLGYRCALLAAAQRADELDYLWQPISRPTYEQRVAARAARHDGREDWPGVDYMTAVERHATYLRLLASWTDQPAGKAAA